MTTSTNNISQQANLLACKQWWKVCFLHGDQQKYYRQIYGKAAAERLALANQSKDPPTIDDKPSSSTTSALHPTTPSLFPAKHSSRRRSKNYAADKSQQKNNNIIDNNTAMPDLIKPNSRVTVLDDPFLFGLTITNSDHLENLSGEDSGIDNAAFDTKIIIGGSMRSGGGALSPRPGGGDPNRHGLPPRLPEKRCSAVVGLPYNQLGIAAVDTITEGGCGSGNESM